MVMKLAAIGFNSIEDDDECIFKFLLYLNQQLMLHPELVVESDEAQLARISELVDGVEDDDYFFDNSTGSAWCILGYRACYCDSPTIFY